MSCKPIAAPQLARVKACSLPTCDVGLSCLHEYIQTVGKERRQRSGRHDNEGFSAQTPGFCYVFQPLQEVPLTCQGEGKHTQITV